MKYNAPTVKRDIDRGQDKGLPVPAEHNTRLRGGETSEGRTTTAQQPAMSHPILCASQFTPSESQKVDWSITDWFSVGQRVLLVSDMGLWSYE